MWQVDRVSWFALRAIGQSVSFRFGRCPPDIFATVWVAYLQAEPLSPRLKVPASVSVGRNRRVQHRGLGSRRGQECLVERARSLSVPFAFLRL